nr:hypothetical protein [Tanacetum cinerariifolium]
MLGVLKSCIMNAIIMSLSYCRQKYAAQKFRAAKTSLNTEESGRDDKEDYEIQRNSFGAPVYGPKLAKYLNCHDPLDRSIALQEVLNPFRKIRVWKKAVSFLESLPVALQHEDWKPKYTGIICWRTTGYDKMQKNDLWLLSMFEARHPNGFTNVAWLIARRMKRKGDSSQKEALDTTTLRELIDSKGRLIPKVPEPSVPRFTIPRPPRASMQDLYERMDSMEIRQEAIKRMYYRQSYH